MKRWLAAAACAAIACACRHERTAPKPAPAVIAPDPSASAPVASASAASTPPPAPPDPCADYRRRLDARLRHALAGIRDAGPAWPEADVKLARSEAGLECFSFARGAWWIEPGSDLDVSTPALFTSRETIHASVDGRALGPWSPDGDGIAVGAAGMAISLGVMLAGDYDGDGIPELWVRTDEDGVEGGHIAESWIVTVHDGKIGEYAPAHGLGTIGTPIDVDGDGRMDLPVSRELATVEGQCFSKTNDAPADFLAHALPNGKFSTTDAVAMARVNRWCPAMPAKIATREDALCARLRSKPADRAKVRATLAASCVPWDCDAQADHKPQKAGANQLCSDLLDTFDQETTLSLP